MLKLNPSLLCNPLTHSQLSKSKPMLLLYADVIWKCSSNSNIWTNIRTDTDINSATKWIIYSETNSEKIKNILPKISSKNIILKISSKNVKLLRPSVPNFDFITVRHQKKKQRKVCVDSHTHIKTQTYTHLMCTQYTINHSHGSTHKTVMIHELSI